MNYSVYKIVAPDGRVYIGTTTQKPKSRWNHGNGYRFCEDMWNLIVSQGWESFQTDVIKTDLTYDEACKMEQELIVKYDACNPEKGFNREGGGIFKKKIVLDSTRKRISEAQMGEKNNNYGKPRPDDVKEKIRLSNLGKKRSAETCKRVGKAKEKPVAQFTKDGEFVAEYPSGKIAAEMTGIRKYCISKNCLGKQATAGGYVWRYAQKITKN